MSSFSKMQNIEGKKLKYIYKNSLDYNLVFEYIYKIFQTKVILLIKIKKIYNTWN